MKNGPWLYLLLAYSLTVPLVFIGERFQASSDLVAYLKIGCLLTFAAYAVRIWRRRWIDPRTPLALAVAIGFTWSCLFALELYKSVTLIPLTFSFAFSSLADTRRTLDKVIGPFGAVYAAALFLFVLCAASAAAWALLRLLRQRLVISLRPLPALACLGLLSYLGAGDARYVAE